MPRHPNPPTRLCFGPERSALAPKSPFAIFSLFVKNTPEDDAYFLTLLLQGNTGTGGRGRGGGVACHVNGD